MKTFGDKTYTWQGRNLKTFAEGTDQSSYVYNADGIRTKKTVNGTTTEYFLNGKAFIKTIILENWKRWNKVIIPIAFVLLLFVVIRSEFKIQGEVAREIKHIVSTVEITVDLLESTKSEESKVFIFEMAYNSIKNSEEAIDSLTKDSLVLSGYDLDELSFYILTLYGEEDIDVAHEKMNELNMFIDDTGIKKIVENETYNYLFDSRDVKQMMKEINDYCHMD